MMTDDSNNQSLARLTIDQSTVPATVDPIENAIGFWCKFSREGRLSLFHLLRVRERFAQKFSTSLILKTSIVNLARADASRFPIIRSPLRHQNQICGEPPIADPSRHCLSAIEKLRCQKGSVGFESETSADRLSPANPLILNRLDPAHAGIIKD